MISLAIFNMLPLFPFDGERYLYTLLQLRLKKGLKAVRTVINVFSVSLIALNIGLTFIRYGLTPI
jgi:Zn-dependent protease